jgi:hypothetical protein
MCRRFRGRTIRVLGYRGVADTDDAPTCADGFGANHYLILATVANRPQAGMQTQPMGTKSAPC